jgi:hypothetical protein
MGERSGIGDSLVVLSNPAARWVPTGLGVNPNGDDRWTTGGMGRKGGQSGRETAQPGDSGSHGASRNGGGEGDATDKYGKG